MLLGRGQRLALEWRDGREKPARLRSGGGAPRFAERGAPGNAHRACKAPHFPNRPARLRSGRGQPGRYRDRARRDARLSDELIEASVCEAIVPAMEPPDSEELFALSHSSRVMGRMG